MTREGDHLRPRRSPAEALRDLLRGRHRPAKQRAKRLLRTVFSVHGLTLHQHI